MTVDKSEQRIRQMFSEISPRYDFLNHFLSGGVDYYWRACAVQRVPPKGDAPILDVCTGTADLALSYWKTTRGTVPVIGTDFSHEMLQIAKRKSERLTTTSANSAEDPSRHPLHFLEADTQQLPFADDQFQIVCVAFGLRNVTNTERGLREMTRVCRPGGQVVVLEFSFPENVLLRRLYQWYFRRILPRLGQLLAQNRFDAYNYLPESVSEFPQGKALSDLMSRCGLTNVVWSPLTFGISTLYVGEKNVSTHEGRRTNR